MFNSKRSRLEEQLKAVEARIEQLEAEVDNPLVTEQTEPQQTASRQESQGQSDHARARANNATMVDRLFGPEVRKARIKVDLCLAVEQGERLQLALEQLDARRLAQFKALVGDSLQFVVTLGVLRWALGMSWSTSITVALVITVVFGQFYEVRKNSRRTLEVVILERAERIAKQEGISLAEAQRRVEDLKWP